MPTYQTVIDGRQRAVEAATGDYRMVAAMAAALFDVMPPCSVQIWCDELLPDYGPYWYTLRNDAFGRLVVAAGV